MIKKHQTLFFRTNISFKCHKVRNKLSTKLMIILPYFSNTAQIIATNF